MQLLIYIHYWLLFLKYDNFKYTTTSQRLTFNSFLLFHIYYLVIFFLTISFQTLMHKEISHLSSISHILYFESFCYVMYYIVPEICTVGHFSEDCFYCYSQQIKSAVANESLIAYNLKKRAPYFFWVENWYLLTWNLAQMLSNLKTFKGPMKTL